MILRRKDKPEVSIGSRYRRKGMPLVVWEVLAVFLGVDGRQHAMMFNVDDPTWRKTISRAEIENTALYERIADFGD